jgi:hypothetical protein
MIHGASAGRRRMIHGASAGRRRMIHGASAGHCRWRIITVAACLIFAAAQGR